MDEVWSPLRGRVGLLLMLLWAAAWAGCVADEDAVDPTAAPVDDPVADDDAAPIEVPVWEVGDWWRFTDADQGTTTFVVTAATSDAYFVDTDDESYAFYHAQEPVSMLGDQRRSDLAGSQGTDRVEFFRFPLEDGATWTTTWDGEERTIMASRVDDTEFWFEAVDPEGATAVRYGYSTESRWFTFLQFEGGAYQSELSDWGHNYTGEVVRYAVETLVDHELVPDVVSSTATHSTVTLGAEATDLYLMWNVACESGFLSLKIMSGDPAVSEGYQEGAVCAWDHSESGVVATTPGEWLVHFDYAIPEDAGTTSLRLLERTRTVIEIA